MQVLITCQMSDYVNLTLERPRCLVQSTVLVNKVLTHMICKGKKVLYCKLSSLEDIKMTSTAVLVLTRHF